MKSDMLKKVQTKGKDIVTKGKNTAIKAKDTLVDKMDVDDSGQVDINDVVIAAMNIPGIRVDRASFLSKEFIKNHPRKVVDDAIKRTPALAGIPADEIDKIADEVIKFERMCVSGISAALGVPGGWAMAATIPADIAQYYGYTLRVIQKLLYLYGFPEVKVDKKALLLDHETINEIVLCLGVMNGVAGANKAIRGLANALAKGVKTKLMDKALTKGVIFPIVYKIARWFGVTLTKKVFAGFFEKAIPIAGGVIGGGITFLAFKPCCNRLKATLQDTLLSNPKHISSTEEDGLAESIISGEVVDVDYTEIEPVAEPFSEKELDYDIIEDKEKNSAKKK